MCWSQCAAWHTFVFWWRTLHFFSPQSKKNVRPPLRRRYIWYEVKHFFRSFRRRRKLFWVRFALLSFVRFCLRTSILPLCFFTWKGARSLMPASYERVKGDWKDEHFEYIYALFTQIMSNFLPPAALRALPTSAGPWRGLGVRGRTKAYGPWCASRTTCRKPDSITLMYTSVYIIPGNIYSSCWKMQRTRYHGIIPGIPFSYSPKVEVYSLQECYVRVRIFLEPVRTLSTSSLFLLCQPLHVIWITGG